VSGNERARVRERERERERERIRQREREREREREILDRRRVQILEHNNNTHASFETFERAPAGAG